MLAAEEWIDVVAQAAQIGGRGEHVLDRAVVEVEAEPHQTPLAARDERALALGAAVEQVGALEKGEREVAASARKAEAAARVSGTARTTRTPSARPQRKTGTARMSERRVEPSPGPEASATRAASRIRRFGSSSPTETMHSSRPRRVRPERRVARDPEAGAAVAARTRSRRAAAASRAAGSRRRGGRSPSSRRRGCRRRSRSASASAASTRVAPVDQPFDGQPRDGVAGEEGGGEPVGGLVGAGCAIRVERAAAGEIEDADRGGVGGVAGAEAGVEGGERLAARVIRPPPPRLRERAALLPGQRARNRRRHRAPTMTAMNDPLLSGPRPAFLPQYPSRPCRLYIVLASTVRGNSPFGLRRGSVRPTRSADATRPSADATCSTTPSIPSHLS